MGWLALLFLVLIFLVSPGLVTLTASGAPVPVALPAPGLPRAPLDIAMAPASDGEGLSAVAASQSVGLAFTPQISNSAVNQLLAEQQAPGSPFYHDYVTPAQFDSMFEPSSSLVNGIVHYFESYGFTVSETPTGEYQAFGTAGDADSAFGTTLENYNDHGKSYMAPLVEPTLPATFASLIGTVAGLNTNVIPPTPDIAFPTLPGSGLQPLASHLHPTTPAPKSSRPHLLTIDLNGIFISPYNATTYLFAPPVGQNVSVIATVIGGSPAPVSPCVWTIRFGDGTTTSASTSNCTTWTVYHEYLQAYNQFSALSFFNVSVVDSTGASYGWAQAIFIPSMSAQWMQRVYSELQMVDHGLGGEGATIGLDEMCDPTFTNASAAIYDTDVANFSTIMGLPAANIDYVGPGYPACGGNWGWDGWSEETLLDMEWAHAMAPNATLEVYMGIDGPNMPWENYADLDGGDAYWATNLGAGVFIASNSWGFGESSTITGAGLTPQLYHNIWAQGAAEGLSFFSSAGDCGASDGIIPNPAGSTVASMVNWPASDPDGVGVGGTILQTSYNGTWESEYVWNGTYSNTSCENNEGTGGGFSCVYNAPAFQLNMPALDEGYWKPEAGADGDCASLSLSLTGQPRGVPDVAADAATWAATNEFGTWDPVGGTSLASPMWAAMAAVSLTAQGLNARPVGLLDNQFYDIGESNLTYERDFHDVIIGTNCNLQTPKCNPRSFSSLPTWNPCAGWGSPDLVNLTADLTGTIRTFISVSGRILNRSNGQPIGDAYVRNGAALNITNKSASWPVPGNPVDGFYFLYVQPGSVTLTVNATNATLVPFATNSVGLLANTTNLYDVNIYLTWNASATPVSGRLVSSTGIPIGDGLVQAINSTGVNSGSTGTSSYGNFTLWLLPGIYTLTGSAPVMNDSSITVSVGSLPVIELAIMLPYAKVTVEGQALTEGGRLPIWDATVTGSVREGDSFVSASGTTSAAGQFFLHLPQGNATISASALGYASDTVYVRVYHLGLGGVLLLLYPTGQRDNQVTLTVKFLDWNFTPGGVPILESSLSTWIEIWANNSLTGTPQLGIYLEFSDTASGTFSSLNVTVGNGTAGSWAPGVAFVHYTAPFLSAAEFDAMDVEVLTPGWSGSSQSELYLLPYSATCSTPVCSYNVWGVVVSTSGARLEGASVELTSAAGVVLATVSSNPSGIYSTYLPNGTYFAVATLSGYYKAAPTPFVVNGTPEEVDLVLEPVPPAVTSGYNADNNLLSADPWLVLPLLIVGLLVAVAAALRLFLPDRSEEEKGGGPAPAATASPEQQIFAGGAPPAAGAVAPGAPPPSALGPSGADTGVSPTVPESPWEITPAPQAGPSSPAPGEMPPDGVPDDGSNSSGDLPPDDGADSSGPPSA